MKKNDLQTIHLKPVPHDSLKVKHPDCDECKQTKLPQPSKQETPAQAKIRISEQLKLEIEAYQKQGLPNEMIALRIYAALIDSRLTIERLQATIENMNIVNAHRDVFHGKTPRSC